MKKILLPLLLLVSTHAFAKPVNINTADAQTIADSLTNIALKKAEAIVADRTKNGHFKTADDLDRVAGIGKKTIEINRKDILVTDVKPVTPPPATATSTTPKPPEVKK